VLDRSGLLVEGVLLATVGSVAELAEQLDLFLEQADSLTGLVIQEKQGQYNDREKQPSHSDIFMPDGGGVKLACAKVPAAWELERPRPRPGSSA
jgi:hypothetical protein